MAGRSRRSHSLEGSVLLKQLGQAHQYISGLEEYIRERERNYQSAISQLRVGERRDSVGPRRGGRRVGRSHDIFMQMRGMGSVDYGDEEDQEALQLLLGNFVKLKIVRVEEGDREGAEYVPVPFALRRMVGQEYHIGPEGASIGVAPHCTITLPKESGLEKEHCYIAWEDNNEQQTNRQRRRGCFTLENLTDNGALCLCSETYSDQMDESEETQVDSSVSTVFPVSLSCGVRFMTGQIVWQLSALPQEVENLALAFYLAQNRKLTELKDLIESFSPPLLPTLAVVEEEDQKCGKLLFHPTGFNGQKGIDVNAVYNPPSYKDEESAFTLSGTKRPVRNSMVPTTPRPVLKHTPQLLLHIAIDNADMKMINYLLDKGADVNLTAGEMSYNAVHLAALRNLPEVMSVLLQYGADLELRNVEHHTPLALTTNYEIRKLLLNSIMLCAAAEAGDSSEVSRLLSSHLLSPNVRGLRHKNPLHLSAAAGQANIVELLLLHNVNVDTRGGSRHRTALHYASAGGHTRVVELLLAVGASELVRDTGGYTPLNVCQGDACRLLNKQPLSLCLAVQSGDVEAVREIVGGEGDGRHENTNVVNLRNDQGHTPLHLACILGNIEMVVLLVSHGADVNLHGGSDGWTPLLYSAMAGHSDAVEFLLSVGADPQKGNSDGEGVRETLEKVEEELNSRLSELQKRKRSESLVESMLLPRHSINMLGRQVSSPTPSVEQELLWVDKRLTQLQTSLSLLTTPAEKLLASFESRNLSNFNYILEEGKVDVNGPADRQTPMPILVRVCEESMLHYAKALLESGANPNLVGAEDEVPLLVAASNGDTPLLKLLVDHGADVNVQSTDRQMTALHMAAICNDIESVRYLVSAGTDRKLSNSSGELPFDCTTVLEIRQLLAAGTNELLVAVSSEDVSLVKKLISEKAIDVNTEFCHNSYTVLHEACEGESLELVELLLQLGANVNKRGGLYQCTPLHITSRTNNIDIACLLLSHGAKLDITDYEGKVPLEVACTNQMRKLLVEARQPALVSHEAVSDGEKRCLICMDNLINTIILPCGHQAFCKECVTKITQCALDRKPIREVIPLYRS